MVDYFRDITFRIPRTAWTDSLVLAGVLFFLNSLLAPFDLGWFNLYPSPWVLLPILIGSKYGVIPGLSSGALSSVITLLMRSYQETIPISEVFQKNSYFLFAMLFFGFFCGDLQKGFRKKILQLNAVNDNIQKRLKKLDTDLALLREAKLELERVMATKDCEVSTLDGEMRRLFESEGNEFYQNFLLLLGRQVRITDAGIYVKGNSGKLERQAVIGKRDALPETIDSHNIEIVNVAINNKIVVTIPEFWQQAIGEQKNYLMAVPLMDSLDNCIGVLVVTGMPFIALNKKTVNFVDMLCRWASHTIELRLYSGNAYRLVKGLDNQRLYNADFFRYHLELAYQSYRQHNLASSVVIVSLKNETISKQAEFEKAFMSTVRSGDFAAEVHLERPHVVMLLPLTGERGAKIFQERVRLKFPQESTIGKNLHIKLVSFEGYRSFDAIWEAILSDE